MDTATNAYDGDADPTAPDPAAYLGPPGRPGELGTLGRYRVQKQLGAGGMGAVFLGVDEALDRQVALKVMLPHHAAKATAKERFLREARAAAKVKSDHVVAIYDVAEMNGVPFIAMECLQGQPLDEFLKSNGNPSAAQILRIGREVAAGLADAHALGLVHRDIKPANLWLEAPKGRVKILDFGLARSLTEDVQLTNSGAIVGTPAYMSPEQALGKTLDGRSDLFSLGGVLYRLCTGRLPFPGQSPMEVLTRLATEEPTPVRSLNPDIPEALAKVVHTLLAKNPEDRYATADEAGRAIAAVTLPGDGATQTLLIAPAAKKKAPWALIGGLAAVAVLVAVAAVVWFNKNKPNPGGPEVVESKDKPNDAAANSDRGDPNFFNGKDFQWWDLDVDVWKVENGEFVGVNPNHGYHWTGYLPPVRDFDFSFEAKCTLDGGPGQASLRFRRDRLTGRMTCLSLGDEAGAVYDYTPESKNGPLQFAELFKPADAVQRVVKAGDYNAYTVRLVGRRLTVTVNGVVACDREIDSAPGDQLVWSLRPECTELRVRNLVFKNLSSPSPTDSERKSAEALLPHATLTLKLAAGAVVTVKQGGQLPASAFTVTKIEFPTGIKEAPFVADVLLTALAGLGGLEDFDDVYMALFTTEGEFALLADMPAAKTLTRLKLRFPLTAGSVAALRKFPKLTKIACYALGATDQLVATLAADHPALTFLALHDLSGTAVTRTSWEAVAKLPLMILALPGIETLNPASAKILAGIPTLEFLFLTDARVTDTAILELAAARMLRKVFLSGTPITDASLAALQGLKTLKTVDVTRTKVTAAGVAKFKAARPDVSVEWDDPALKKG